MFPMLILIVLVLGLWAVGFLLLPRLRSCRAGGGRESAGELSVIIPARNEEHNLPLLLESLAAQAVRPREIIVVDDGSADRTAETARAGGATVITSKPLPDGWRGKTWACHQGAEHAAGGLLCFVDADTTFEPGGLARMLSCYVGGAFSAGPWHAVKEAYENLSLFFNLNMVAGTVPGGLFGQMLLVDRESYRRVGGHEAVRGRVLENFRLAEHFRDSGIPVRSVAGRGVISFRMYPGGTKDLIEGWTKGFASGAGRTPRGTLWLLVAWMVGLMIAPIGLFAGGMRPAWLMVYLACAAQVGWFGRLVGAFHWYAAPVYPVPLVFFFGLFARSAMRSGKNVTWKGRDIRAD
jgi:4,4'-diaponeurosporenoate glycosyltransferase